MLRSFFSRHRAGVTLLALSAASLGLLVASGGDSSADRLVIPRELGLGLFSAGQRALASGLQWIRSTFDSIGELRRARQELEELRERLREAERLSRDIVRLRRENEQLRELLRLSEATTYRNFPARVIARQPGNNSAQIVLDKGSRDGVRRLMPVIAQQRGVTGLVGKVVAVSAHSCAVLPLTSATSFVAARLEASRYDGLVAGQGDLSPLLLMRHVSSQAAKEIAYGDTVVTSGLGQTFPAEIPIGRVRTIRSLAQAASLELEVEPLLDMSRLEQVLIIDAGM